MWVWLALYTVNMTAERDNLEQVLDSYVKERIQLEVSFLNQALEAATINDNHECIGKLVTMGATNIDGCLQLVKKKGIAKSATVLLLLKATLTGDKAALYNLGNKVSKPEFAQVNVSDMMDKVKEAIILSGEVSIQAPMNVAQQNGQHSIQRELLMMTVSKGKGTANWSNLNLMNLDMQLCKAVGCWLRKFNLSSNKLRSIPREFMMLTEVRR